MYYIFNKQGLLIATSDLEPDSDDLSSRQEIAVDSDIAYTNPRYHSHQIVELGTPPSEFHTYDYHLNKWTITDEDIERLQSKEIEQLINNQRAFIINYLNKRAIDKGYLSINDAITYAAEPAVPKYQAEGLAFRRWRSEVWATVHQYFDELETGAPAISNETLLERLPKLTIDET